MKTLLAFLILALAGCATTSYVPPAYLCAMVGPGMLYCEPYVPQE